MRNYNLYINREITWLKFNARVLQEANDISVPLLERLRFLGIYSNNLDEFYRVRYATILRALEIDEDAYNNIVPNQPLVELLDEVKQVVADQQSLYDSTYEEIINEIEAEDICFVDDTSILPEHVEFVEDFFRDKMSHAIAAYLWEPDVDKIPELKDGALYLAVKMHKKLQIQQQPNWFRRNFFRNYRSISNKSQSIDAKYALVEVPTNAFPRFVVLPKVGGKNYIMMLEDIIRYELKSIFHMFDFDNIEGHSIKITKDAELDIDQDVQMSFIEKIEQSVDGRRRGEPVRLVFDKEIAKDTLDYIISILHIDSLDTVSAGGRYHNKKDFIGFPNLGRTDLEFEKKKPLVPPQFQNIKSYIEVVEKKDQLIYAPYVDYSIFLKLLREAAIDPRVKEIKITVYRVARYSQIMSALINAAKNGKKVLAVLELRARFDEANNVSWSKTLQDEGVEVIFGVRGLKVHSKIGLLKYHDDNGNDKSISIVSTGNFHEKTARIYTDFTLMTADDRVTKDVADVFEFFRSNYRIKDYKNLMLSPLQMRNKLYKLIDQEIKNQKKGNPAEISIKVNGLSDKGMIDKLYQASKAGVKVRLVIRGICCLVPGIKGVSENITSISIIDKYLEHPRIYWFKNAGEDIVYISSADLMTRNIDNRVEVGCPVYDLDLKKQVMDTFDLSFTDNVKARLQTNLPTEIYHHNNLPPNRSQESIYNYYQELYK